MTKLKAVLVAASVAALALLPTQAMASGCPDGDNPCTPPMFDPLEGVCAKIKWC